MNYIRTLISFWQTLTREQKEGAFSNFPISEETIKLLKGTMNFNAYAIENLKLDCRKLLYLFWPRGKCTKHREIAFIIAIISTSFFGYSDQFLTLKN